MMKKIVIVLIFSVWSYC